MSYKTISFDWKASGGDVVDEIAEILKQFNIFVTEVDTESDSFFYIISDTELTDEEVAKIYDEWSEE